MVAVIRRGKKRKLEQSSEDEAECQRLQSSTSMETTEYIKNEGPHILDLPLELMSIILQYTGSCREIARIRTVCRRFDVICSQVLLSEFFKIQVKIERQEKQAEDELRFMLQKLAEKENTTTYLGRRALSQRALCTNQLKCMASQLRLVRAWISAYVSAGACSFYCGDLLDIYKRILQRIATKKLGTKPNTRPAFQGTMKRCRELTHQYLMHIQGVIENHCEMGELDHSQKILPAVVFIDLLHSCIDCSKQVPAITQDPKGRGTCRVQATYTLNGCWFGILWAARGSNWFRESDAIQLCVILRELVWVSNHEFLAWEYAQREQIIMGKNNGLESKNDSKACFNAVEDRGDRVFFFGHQQARSIPGIYGCTGPPPKLTFEIDIICHEDFLPQRLLTDALNFTSGDRVDEDMFDGITFRVDMMMACPEMAKWGCSTSYHYISEEVKSFDRDSSSDEDEVHKVPSASTNVYYFSKRRIHKPPSCIIAPMGFRTPDGPPRKKRCRLAAQA